MARDACRAKERLAVQRRDLEEELEARRRRLEKPNALGGRHPGMTGRIAIEATLIKRGPLGLARGGWC